jgi:hypothetical protein
MALETYLVEHYLPGLDADHLWRAVVAIRCAAEADGTTRRALHYVRSTVVPGDEAFISIFEAESEQSVRDAYARAGLSFDRISKVIEEQVGSPQREELQ